jgi:hypothetical protein
MSAFQTGVGTSSGLQVTALQHFVECFDVVQEAVDDVIAVWMRIVGFFVCSFWNHGVLFDEAPRLERLSSSLNRPISVETGLLTHFVD